MSSDNITSSGVQQLIDRLHEEGVAKGQEEADVVVTAARQQAMDLLDQARQEAEEIVSAARQEAEHAKAGGEEAIRLAGRDTILSLTEELRDDFVRKLRGLVDHSLKDTDFLKQLILEIVRHAVSEGDGAKNVVLLADRTSTDAAANLSNEDALDDFVRSLGGSAVSDGLTFEVGDADVPGVRVQLVDDNLEIDLTTETLTHLLLKHLSPRFRSILQEQ